MKDCFIADTFIKDLTTKMLTVNLNVIMPFRVCLLLNKMLFLSRIHLTLTHNRAVLTERFIQPPVPTLLLLGICGVSALWGRKNSGSPREV